MPSCSNTSHDPNVDKFPLSFTVSEILLTEQEGTNKGQFQNFNTFKFLDKKFGFEHKINIVLL
jgi:hypothetical protein